MRDRAEAGAVKAGMGEDMGVTGLRGIVHPTGH